MINVKWIPGFQHSSIAVLLFFAPLREIIFMYINGMSRLDDCIKLYIGCQTNKGKLIGVVTNSIFIYTEQDIIREYDIEALGRTIFLYLQQLRDITDEQSKELNKKGFNIGRPSGYTFSNEAFLYLLELHVDLFGLISSGIAKDLKTI